MSERSRATRARGVTEVAAACRRLHPLGELTGRECWDMVISPPRPTSPPAITLTIGLALQHGHWGPALTDPAAALRAAEEAIRFALGSRCACTPFTLTSNDTSVQV